VFSTFLGGIRVASLAITSAISGVQNNSKYSRGLLKSSKSIFMPGFQVNGKRDRSAPDFAHMPCWMLTVVIDIFFFIEADTLFTT
jgi:hypothetical protein